MLARLRVLPPVNGKHCCFIFRLVLIRLFELVSKPGLYAWVNIDRNTCRFISVCFATGHESRRELTISRLFAVFTGSHGMEGSERPSFDS